MVSLHLQIVLIIAIFCYFIVIIKLLKNKALSLKYSLLWLFAGVVMGLLVLIPQLLYYFTKIIGIQTPMYALIVMCLAFIVAILMSLTSIVSRQNTKIRTLTQEIAILEKKIREIDDQISQT